jgi:hypothetical protein
MTPVETRRDSREDPERMLSGYPTKLPDLPWAAFGATVAQPPALFGGHLGGALTGILAGHDVETHPESNPGPILFGMLFPAGRRPIGAGTPS